VGFQPGARHTLAGQLAPKIPASRRYARQAACNSAAAAGASIEGHGSPSKNVPSLVKLVDRAWSTATGPFRLGFITPTPATSGKRDDPSRSSRLRHAPHGQDDRDEIGLCLEPARFVTGVARIPAGNAAERFFANIKRELIDARAWPTRASLQRAVFDYIEGWYNTRRLHRSLDTAAQPNGSPSTVASTLRRRNHHKQPVKPKT